MPSQTQTSSQKRKAGEDGAPKPPLKKLQVSVDSSSSAFPPILAGFPSVQPAASTPFRLYERKGGDSSKSLEDRNTLLVGETPGVEFSSINQDAVVADASTGYSCRYLLGVHDPSTNTLTLSPSPTYLLAHQVKRLKGLNPLKADEAATRIEDRNKLGEAFGTKKAKSRIKTVERNKIDTAGMEHMRAHLEESIQEGAKDLPSMEAIKAISDGARPIPPPNMDAESPAEAYSLKDIISPSSKSALKPFLEQLAACEGDRDRIKLLPFSHSDWVNKRLKELNSANKPNKEKLRMVVFVSAMRQFERLSRSVGDRPKLVEKMGSTPKVVLDSLLEMFTESPRGTGKPQFTPATEAKLWSYMFVLCLMVDNYSSDINELAKDLNMPPAKVTTLFKGLGCSTDILSTKEREAAGITMVQAKSAKKAVLKTPLVFKDPSRGPAKR